MSFFSLRKLSVVLAASSFVITTPNAVSKTSDKFRQLDEIWPTPSDYRNASGAPGHLYWQQKVDYVMDLSIDPKTHRLVGNQKVSYQNNSKDSLYYLWVHLDPKIREQESIASRTRTGLSEPRASFRFLETTKAREDFELDFKISHLRDLNGKSLNYTVNQTLLRIDLERPLRPGRSFEFELGWAFNIHDQKTVGGRFGYEYFKEKDNYLYQLSTFFPRMVAYSDAKGWHNRQFLGSGEFTLEFGDYEVSISVPDTHVVAATGELTNPKEVLNSKQRDRLEKAATADKPMFIITPEEAIANETKPATATKTWKFSAKDVRDFAFASSPKFIWDAQGVKSGDKKVLAMSFYPEEALPLWDKYSTHSIVHTIEQYNHYTFDYPYPTAISVNGPVGGMEYPMITFNGPRPEIDEKTGERTYSRRTKYGLISVIIHEIGHIYFPMIVNSDEREWTWMDEGLNTFLQTLAEHAWEEDYPSTRGEPRSITAYMASPEQVPIMTNSESILQFGNNAYAKPATALTILRETIMGRELFDFAFKEYSRRWKFKRPMPPDFFRTMEDASGLDLDWFWRGWFYTTDHVDISLDKVTHYTINTQDMSVERNYQRAEKMREPSSLSSQRNQGMPRRVERYPELKDFYNEFDEFSVSPVDKKNTKNILEGLSEEEKKTLQDKRNIFVLDFSNKGGLVMPIILEITYEDGNKELKRIPAEIWRRNSQQVSTMLITERLVEKVVVDPFWETADVDVENNHFPRRAYRSRLEVFKEERGIRNLMKEMLAEPEETLETANSEESTKEAG